MAPYLALFLTSCHGYACSDICSIYSVKHEYPVRELGSHFIYLWNYSFIDLVLEPYLVVKMSVSDTGLRMGIRGHEGDLNSDIV